MGAVEKTKSLVRIADCPLDLLVKNENNPNRMRPREFDLLCDNMTKTGWTDPALVRPLDLQLMKQAVKQSKSEGVPVTEIMQALDCKLRIVGGHHRYDAACYLGLETGPVTVIMDPEFDEEQETFQIVRMNVIHGRMDPQAFTNMFNKLSSKYSDEVLQDSFGFADEVEFKKLIVQMAKSLPNEQAQKQFKDAAKEIKTIDGLAKLLNQMFTTFGDTLPHGYMVFDYGGHRSVWIRIETKTLKALDILGQMCIERQRTMDDILGGVVQLIAKEGSADFLDALMADTPETAIPDQFPALPTKDNLAKIAEGL